MTSHEFAFSLQLIATLIGVLVVGLVGGFAFHLYRQKNDRKKTRNRLIDSVIAELKNDIKPGVDAFINEPVTWDKTNRKFDGEKPATLTTAFDSFTHTGFFGDLPEDLQKNLSNAYLNIKYINNYTDQIRNFDYEHASRVGYPQVQDKMAEELCDKVKKNVDTLNIKLVNLPTDLEDFRNDKNYPRISSNPTT